MKRHLDSNTPLSDFIDDLLGIFETADGEVVIDAVQARQATMWLAANYTSKSVSEIGRLTGGHNHRTVSEAIIRAEFQRERDKGFAERLQLAIGIVEQVALKFQETGVTCRPDPDPLVIARRVLASKHSETLISLEEIRVLATAVVVTFDNEEQNDE